MREGKDGRRDEVKEKRKEGATSTRFLVAQTWQVWKVNLLLACAGIQVQ